MILQCQQTLQQQFPQQENLFETGYALVAINQELVTDETQPLQPQDEVAILPPMTGG